MHKLTVSRMLGLPPNTFATSYHAYCRFYILYWVIGILDNVFAGLLNPLVRKKNVGNKISNCEQQNLNFKSHRKTASR